MQYDLTLEHENGEQNKVTDCLSRITEELSIDEVENVPEAKDKVEFPITIYALQYKLPKKSWQSRTYVKPFVSKMLWYLLRIPVYLFIATFGLKYY